MPMTTMSSRKASRPASAWCCRRTGNRRNPPRPRRRPRSADSSPPSGPLPPRRPSQPASLTRTSYQVGSPWMFDGKMLRGLTGTPMRRIALANSSFAEAEPEPLTLANLMTKSLVAVIGDGTGQVGSRTGIAESGIGNRKGAPLSPEFSHLQRTASRFPILFEVKSSHAALLALRQTAPRPRVDHLQEELLHVPGAGGAAFGAQAAVQADVLVLDHHAAGLQAIGRRTGPGSGSAPARSGAGAGRPRRRWR
jgi:hypothetical protein